MNGRSIRVRKSPRLKKHVRNDYKTFSTRFKKQVQNNYHVHYYKRSGDKLFYCTECNNFKCCNRCPDCNSEIFSDPQDFDSEDDLKIDSEVTSVKSDKSEVSLFNYIVNKISFIQ